ncbi:MAG: SDR family NAD(P)-dependent oxidoreductase [Gammaproteobacteria bacterium]|nr:SDR family NAD(P)-dependent oxidoreductase [Gammaproteobacteria bacterium]
MKDFSGKTAVVTGAASGIGLALAERFAAARMQVVLADIQKDALDRAVEKLEATQARVIGVVVDTMQKASVQALAERAINAFGKIHILCNNAGVASTRNAVGTGIWEVPDEDWCWVLGVNLHGVVHGLQAFVPHMLAHGEEGHIVNTASLAGLLPGGGTYGVSKHGVVALTETLYNDFRVRNAKLGASVLCPGMVSTNIIDAERNRPDELKHAGGAQSEKMRAMGRATLAAGKAPSEIADIVFRAIEENNVYILPHPAWDDFLQRRFDAILARKGAAVIDLNEMIQRRAKGEQF